MSTEKPDLQAEPGEPALLFNTFSLPSYATGLGAPLSETCGKQEMFLGSLTSNFSFLCLKKDILII